MRSSGKMLLPNVVFAKPGWGDLKNTCFSGPIPRNSDYFQWSPNDSNIPDSVQASITLIYRDQFICLSGRCENSEGKNNVILFCIPSA